MSGKNLLLIVAALLVVVGLTKPDLSRFINKPSDNNVVDVINVIKPSDPAILEKCEAVIEAIKSGPSSRSVDGKRLAALYLDIATLVELDGEDLVITDTESLRQANKLAGLMLRLDMKNKYPKLKDAAQDVVVQSIGDDHVSLDAKLRKQAANGFRALAWACSQGAK